MKTLGERCVDWAMERIGVHEHPMGSHSGPEVADYLAPCVRRDTNKVLGLKSGNWCSAFASRAAYDVLEQGDLIPHGYRAAVVELVADAMDCGAWRPVGDGYVPAIGDLAIWDRSTPGKPETSWYRHVNRVTMLGPDGTFQTIGGNEGGKVALSKHKLDNPKLLGFISYPTAPNQAIVPSLFTEQDRQHALNMVAMSLDALSRDLSGA